MTNYEWLVKQDLLGKFLEDFQDNTISIEDMNNRYGYMHLELNRSYSEDVAAWLQEEHKESDVYVKLEDVINIVTDTNTLNASYSIHFFSKYCADLIRKLPTKIMDEQEK